MRILSEVHQKFRYYFLLKEKNHEFDLFHDPEGKQILPNSLQLASPAEFARLLDREICQNHIFLSYRNF